MRFLLINRFFGSEGSPTGRMLYDVALALVSRGNLVTVLTSEEGYARRIDLSHLRSASLRLLTVKSAGCRRVTNWAWFWLNALLRISLVKWDRCLVLTDPPFTLAGAWLARRLARKNGPLFWWTMDLYPEALEAAGILSRHHPGFKFLSSLNELGLSATQGVIALGVKQQNLLMRYRRWRHDPSFCIVVSPWDYRPFADLSEGLNPLAQRFGWASKKVALYAGNLGRAHSFTEILAAAKWFADRGRNDWIFVFAVRKDNEALLRSQTKSLPNVKVMNYVPESEAPALLCAATVHFVTIRPGWEGIIVPSKLYSSLRTSAPILYIGPAGTDTAEEILRLDRGVVLKPGAFGSEVAGTLDELSHSNWLRQPHRDLSGLKRLVNFLMGDVASREVSANLLPGTVSKAAQFHV